MMVFPKPSETGIPFDPETPVLCVETASGLVCEAKYLSEEHVLVRPVSPELYNKIKKFSWAVFYRDFEEYYGDRKTVEDFRQGWQTELNVDS